MKESLAIFRGGGGRFANQLINFGHLIAWAEENPDRFGLINLRFWEYSDLVCGTESNVLCRYPVPVDPAWSERAANAVAKALQKGTCGSGTKLVGQVLKHLCRFPEIRLDDSKCDHVDLGSIEFNDAVAGNRVTVLSGYGFRNWDLFGRHQPKIRDFLLPARRFHEAASSFVRSVRHRYDVLVGVYIRQDDYRIWRDGEYFFETGAYVDRMKDVVNMFPSQVVGFIVASDEVQDEGDFRAFDFHMATGNKAGPGHYLENMVELSLCDLVMSPPSTFGAWAAFLRNKPLLPICEPNVRLDGNMVLRGNILDACKHPRFSDAVH